MRVNEDSHVSEHAVKRKMNTPTHASRLTALAKINKSAICGRGMERRGRGGNATVQTKTVTASKTDKGKRRKNAEGRRWSTQRAWAQYCVTDTSKM